MAKIKHIALSTANPEATAKFYVDVFGMKEIGSTIRTSAGSSSPMAISTWPSSSSRTTW